MIEANYKYGKNFIMRKLAVLIALVFGLTDCKQRSRSSLDSADADQSSDFQIINLTESSAATDSTGANLMQKGRSGGGSPPAPAPRGGSSSGSGSSNSGGSSRAYSGSTAPAYSRPSSATPPVSSGTGSISRSSGSSSSGSSSSSASGSSSSGVGSSQVVRTPVPSRPQPGAQSSGSSSGSSGKATIPPAPGSISGSSGSGRALSATVVPQSRIQSRDNAPLARRIPVSLDAPIIGLPANQPRVGRPSIWPTVVAYAGAYMVGEYVGTKLSNYLQKRNLQKHPIYTRYYMSDEQLSSGNFYQPPLAFLDFNYYYGADQTTGKVDENFVGPPEQESRPLQIPSAAQPEMLEHVLSARTFSSANGKVTFQVGNFKKAIETCSSQNPPARLPSAAEYLAILATIDSYETGNNPLLAGSTLVDYFYKRTPTKKESEIISVFSDHSITTPNADGGAQQLSFWTMDMDNADGAYKRYTASIGHTINGKLSERDPNSFGPDSYDYELHSGLKYLSGADILTSASEEAENVIACVRDLMPQTVSADDVANMKVVAATFKDLGPDGKSNPLPEGVPATLPSVDYHTAWSLCPDGYRIPFAIEAQEWARQNMQLIGSVYGWDWQVWTVDPWHRDWTKKTVLNLRGINRPTEGALVPDLVGHAFVMCVENGKSKDTIVASKNIDTSPVETCKRPKARYYKYLSGGRDVITSFLSVDYRGDNIFYIGASSMSYFFDCSKCCEKYPNLCQKTENSDYQCAGPNNDGGLQIYFFDKDKGEEALVNFK